MAENVYPNDIWYDQYIALLVQEGIIEKEEQLFEALFEIERIAAEKMQYAQTALDSGLNCIENVRNFTSNPTHILGSELTKHGEIAEHIEVEIRNGRDILNHIKPTATFDGVGRTAPEDYLIDGIQVQSKFTNGTTKTLEHALGHMRTYPSFLENGYYHIPKDQYNLINRVLNNDTEGISPKTVLKLKHLVNDIEQESGKPFSEVVRPGISNYNEVQLGKVDQTLDQHEDEFRNIHKREVKEIRNSEKAKKDVAQHITDPSWEEALKYAAFAAVLEGGTTAIFRIVAKIQSGTKIANFSINDWKEVGYDFLKGGVKGGIKGIGIYGFTKLGHFSAPFAGAVVSTAVGILSLVVEYKKGRITKSDLGECAQALSVEAGLSAIGASIGQMLIPIPVAGAIIGIASAKAALEISKYICGKHEADIIEQMQAEYDALVDSLGKECQAIIGEMDKYYQKLGGYINAALSPISAIRFYGSIELCRCLNVPEEWIIHDISELDIYMLS